MRNIIQGKIKELENVKTTRSNNRKSWVRKIDVDKLLKI